MRKAFVNRIHREMFHSFLVKAIFLTQIVIFFSELPPSYLAVNAFLGLAIVHGERISIFVWYKGRGELIQ
jgi:membrane-bound metal-dependent hydrolase YbcI (DUF457 family)